MAKLTAVISDDSPPSLRPLEYKMNFFTAESGLCPGQLPGLTFFSALLVVYPDHPIQLLPGDRLPVTQLCSCMALMLPHGWPC